MRRRAESLQRRVEAAEATGDYSTRSFRDEINELPRLIPAKPGSEIFLILDGLNRRVLEAVERQSKRPKLPRGSCSVSEHTTRLTD